MAVCIDPGTRSPGKLNLVYYHNTGAIRHVTGWHFITGVDPTNIAPLQAEADRLALLLQPCVTIFDTITDWEVRLPDGSLYYTAALAAPRIGTHVFAAGATEWYSTSLELGGKAPPRVAGGCSGRSKCTIFHAGSVPMDPGRKSFDVTPDGAWRAFVDGGLNASTYLPADFYGIQVNISHIGHVQFNAHVQGEHGT